MTLCRIAVPAIAVLFSVTGCATTSPPESGFLTDYSGLVKDEGERGVWVYRNPKTTYAEYQRVMIDPFVVGFGPHKANVLFSAKELDKLGRYMRDAVAKIVAEHFPVVEEPGKGTLRLRVALTHLVPSSGPKSWQASGGLPAGLNVALGGVSFEGETLDSVTGEQIHAFVAVDQSRTPTTETSSQWSQAIAVMDEFGRRFREELDKAHGRE